MMMKHDGGISRPSASQPSPGSTSRSFDYGSALKKGLSPATPKHWDGLSSSKASPLSGGSSRQSSDGASRERRTPSGREAKEVESEDLLEVAEGDEWKEWGRMSKLGRKKDFVLVEKIRGRDVNILQGLELHTDVFNSKEQERIVNHVHYLQKLGRDGMLKERTYSEPKKWMRGKGRVTLQFGCCYNYAEDKDGNPPGILREEEVDSLPSLFKMMIRRLVRWRVLPPSCVPDSCIVNIYDKGDCIPPHIDHHDFLRPFCTISFLAECNILFGYAIEVIGPGEFAAPVAVPLPTGSVFILNGNGADVAKHCVPGVPAKRISITFRKMKPEKIPHWYTPDPKLRGLMPLKQPSNKSPAEMAHANSTLFGSNQHAQQTGSPSSTMSSTPYLSATISQAQKRQQQRSSKTLEDNSGSNLISRLTFNDDDFPALGASNTKRR